MGPGILDSVMDLTQQQALLSLALHAAYADGESCSAERDAVQRLAERFAQQGVPMPSWDPAERARTVDALAAQLRAPETAQIAYEMAASVCEADKAHSGPEREFLSRLRTALGLEATVVGSVDDFAHELAEAHAIPPAVTPPRTLAPPVLPVAGSVNGSDPVDPPGDPGPGNEELEKLILNNAILAGALELLPGTLATLAILPVQMRLVYRIGKHFGHELDRGHIGEFLATVGVGLTSQVVEGFVERLARGVFGSVAGGLGRMLGGQVASSGMSFATTYALGQLARQYYGGGRNFAAVEVQSLFNNLIGQGRALQSQYLPQIRDQASRLDLRSLPALLRG